MVDKKFVAKVFVIVLAAWFFFGLVVLSIPNPYIQQCTQKCSAAGFDTVLGADAESCWCRSSISRLEQTIENG